MRRSIAVIVVACLLILGGVTGAALWFKAKHNPMAAAPSTFHCWRRKKCRSGVAQCDGIRARVEARAGRRCKHFVFAYRENAAGAFQPLLSTIFWRPVLSANAA